MLATKTHDPRPPHKRLNNPLHSLIAGACAGAANKTSTAPFERVKILCQTGVSTSPFSALRHVLRDEGVVGLWRGNAVSVIRIIPSKAVLFMCSDFFKDMMRSSPPSALAPDVVVPLKSWQYVVAGSMAGGCSVLTTYPLDLVRGRMSGTLGSRYTGILQTLRLTVAEEGWRALYRGMSASLVGALPYEGVRFGVYDVLKARFLTPESPLWMSAVCGAAAGTVASIVLFPNDTVRRRMQTTFKNSSGAGKHGSGGGGGGGGIGGASSSSISTPQSASSPLPSSSSLSSSSSSLSPSSSAASSAATTSATAAETQQLPYRNAVDCYRQLYREGGWRIFYRGLTANVARVVPACAIQFAAFEVIKQALQQGGGGGGGAVAGQGR